MNAPCYPRAPAVFEGRYRGMEDSDSCADCGPRAATRRHRWARANEHVVASRKEPQLEEKAKKNSESHGPGRADDLCDWNLAGRAWPVAGEIGISQAGSGFGP